MNEPPAGPRAVPSPPTDLEGLARAVTELHTALGLSGDRPTPGGTPDEAPDGTPSDVPRDVTAGGATAHVVAVVGEGGRGRTTVARQLAPIPARIIDAPPWGSPGALPDADVVVVAVAAGSPLGMGERQVVEAAAERTGGAPVLIAVTRLDTLDEEERPALLSYVRRRARTILPAVRVVPAGRTPGEGDDLRAEVAAELGRATPEAQARRRLRATLGEDLALLAERATREAASQAQRRRQREAQHAAAEKALAEGEKRWEIIDATLTRRCAQEVTAARTRVRDERESLLQDVLAAHEAGDPAAAARVDRAARAILAQGQAQADAALTHDRDEAVRQVRDRFRTDLTASLAQPPDTAHTAAPEPVPAPAPPPSGSRRRTTATAAAGMTLTVVTLARGASVQAIGIAGLTAFLLAFDHREHGKARAAAARDQVDRIVDAAADWLARYTEDAYTALLDRVREARDQWRAAAAPPGTADDHRAEEPDWGRVQERVAELKRVLDALNRRQYVQHGEVS
ncbi:hypothetical protein ACFZAD_00745 [Streptomyces iakyrus]|uniref:hypothetical protein n=1 Tax=Streptomyces iakyrus TaxID=68219 RepID=UPI0036E4F873